MTAKTAEMVEPVKRRSRAKAAARSLAPGGATSARPLTFTEVATKYARDVIAGRIPSSAITKRAAGRHLSDIDRQGMADFEWTFNESEAARVCRFAQLMPHIKGEWALIAEDGSKPTIKLEPWQVFILASLFGWVHRETGMRRFRTAYIEVPRKNAKSTLAAIIVLYMAFLDGEPGAGVYTAATTREQARIVFDDSRAMALAVPELQRRFGVMVERHQILQPSTNSVLKPITREQSANEGWSVHCGCLDELHAHKSADIYEVLDQGRGARRNSLLFAITTAGSDLGSICFEIRSMVVGILEGLLLSPELDRVFGVIYTIDDGDDPHDPTVWQKANPNLGVSVYEDEFANAHAQAVASPARWNEFLTKRLNVWVRAGSPWFSSEAFRTRCKDEGLARRATRRRAVIVAGREPRADDIPAYFNGRRCYVGLDFATRRDLAALVAAFPGPIAEDGRRVYHVFGHYYLPESALAESRTAAYSGWARAGWITITPGETTDFEFIKRDLLAWRDRFEIVEAPYDPREARQFATQMVNEHGLLMVEMTQSYTTYNEPMKLCDSLIVEGLMHHNGDPVMAYAFGNVTARRGALGDVMPDKDSPQAIIDPAVATMMAVGRASLDLGTASWFTA